MPFLVQVQKQAKSDKQIQFCFKAKITDKFTDCKREEAVKKVQALQNRRFIDHTKRF